MKNYKLTLQFRCKSPARLKAMKSISIFMLMIMLHGVFNNVIAQTLYQPFFSDSTMLYKAQNLDFIEWADQYQKSSYKAAAFDSIVNISGLAFYYPFKTARDTSNQPQGGNCIDVNGNSWMGNYFYHDAQMHYQFINNNYDTIYIHTQENIGHQWICYTYPNGDNLKATITNIAQLNLNGINDSVKTIQLNFFDALGNAGTNSWSQKEFLLSQHYGFIKCPIFNDFPNDTNMVTRQFNLNIATTTDIYDFNLGDKFYYKYERSYNSSLDFYAIDYTLLEVTGKNIDSLNQLINYTFKSTFYDYKIEYPNPVYLDTIVETTPTYSFPLNMSMEIPEKIAFDNSDGIAFNLMQDINASNMLNINSPVYVKNTRIYMELSSNCFAMAITTLPKKSIYAKALGIIYYEEFWNGGGLNPFSDISELIGYQKNGINYGNYLAIENLNKNIAQIFIIKGNPSENLNVEWLAKESGTISVYSSAGTLIFEKNISEGRSKFSFTEFASGIYFVKGISNDNYEVTKFIKN